MKLSEDALQFFREAGKRGGIASKKSLSAPQRKASAKRAAEARWKAAKKTPPK